MHPFASLAVPQHAVGIAWFGQSSFALKDSAGTVIQLDPYFPHERPEERYIYSESPLDETTLPTDYVLLTHNHRDHTWPESLLRIHGAFPICRFVGPVESMQNLREHGIPEELMTVVTADDIVSLGTMRAHVVWAKPPEGAPEDGIAAPDVDHLGYVIEAGGVRVYVSGDPINTFAEHDELIQPIATLKPDIGLLTTHPNEGEFPYFDGSVATANKLGLRTAVPAHYACFVKRDYDPAEWAAGFDEGDPEPLIIPFKGSVVYSVP
jgi:L-ascorbate metabolism protein UlaG (beta-lactamase superfamily)